MKKLFVMLPCYNEEKDIVPLIEKWVQHSGKIEQAGYKIKIYGVDDKSTDQTNRKVRECMQRYPQMVHLIEHKVNQGLGGVLQTGFRYFQTHGHKGDVMALMDGDNTHDPCYVISMLEKIAKGYDCVIASRYCKASKTKGVSPLRLFLSWGARAYYTLVLSVKNVKDYTCGYRVYTYEVIDRARKQYGDQLVEYRSFACMMEVLYKLYLIGAQFQEVPFELRYDFKEGESKMKLAGTIRDSFAAALKLRMNKRRYQKYGVNRKKRGVK
ncbi:MAG: glycosyltransferase family 2 protein [Eubacterium sp.]|nr:glycosyltransferase family 2 protein [Eubacterium sp.]